MARFLNPLAPTPPKPADAILAIGEGIEGYVSDHAGVAALDEYLTAAGFVEETQSATLRVQYGWNSAGEWVEAVVAWGFYEANDGQRVLLTHVVESEDEDMRSRPPQAYVWERGRSGVISYTLEATGSDVEVLP